MFSFLFKIIINYLYVQIAILAFMAPFFAGYWYFVGRHHKRTFSEHIERYFDSRYGNALVFAWAAAEAAVWFVIPEFLLLLVIFMRIHKKRQLLYFDIYGTAFGTLIAYGLHFTTSQLIGVPYITTKMVDQVSLWYQQLGIFGLIHQPFSGVPYKVFTHLAPSHHYPFFFFLIFAVLVRISRYLITYTLFMQLYPFLHEYAYRHYVWLMGVTTFLFSALLLKVFWAYS
jgi:membrane protein YqaA with SNARE-associated domain